jgi:hypothetical protein
MPNEILKSIEVHGPNRYLATTESGRLISMLAQEHISIQLEAQRAMERTILA